MQKAFFLSVLIWIVSLSLFAQKEDHVWLLGGNYSSPDSAYKSCSIVFSGNNSAISFIDKDLPYDITNTIISDSAGSLLCYSNGKNLYNKNFEIMEGGGNFYPNADFEGGVPYIQGYLLLPSPERNNKIVFIYGTPQVFVAPVPGGYTIGYTKLKYALANMGLNSGLGKVMERDIVFSTDTIMPTQIGSIRHGNGRDWWLLAPYHLGNRFYRFLLDPTGLRQIGTQNIQTTDLGLGHTCFSPDGQYYARFNWHGIIPDSSFATVELYRFDRCSGLLSDRVGKTYDLSGLNGKPGGVAFSPNSRFLYVTRWDSIFQYDLHSPDIIASEKTVAVYDGFLGDLGLPTRFFYPLLAPDNKIYICVSNYNSPYLHTIENPDEPGLACHVQQHSVRLPVFNNFLLPNMPFYRLWDWEGAPCDTLESVGLEEVTLEKEGITLFPNPAQTEVQISLQQPAIADCQITVFNLTGQVVAEVTMMKGSRQVILPVSEYTEGFYLLCISDDRRVVYRQKVGIVR
ncbi:MAG: T9SS type A sorting domain-containing protein [Saprospiraceae bacterium]|nr:T9SS type A sorting domain-containing protein [Saprospiraceae bacterium]